MSEFEYAVWYWHTGVQQVQLFPDEKSAAEFAYDTEESGNGSIDGVQRSDGKTKTYGTWPLVQEMKAKAQEEFDRRRAGEVPEPPLRRQVVSPFFGTTATVLADTPEWVGKHE